MDFSEKSIQKPLKTQPCSSEGWLEEGTSLVVFRFLDAFETLRNPYSLDFLFLFGQAKRKGLIRKVSI
jgi:hypothetical protein